MCNALSVITHAEDMGRLPKFFALPEPLMDYYLQLGVSWSYCEGTIAWRQRGKFYISETVK
jgi:hypothetical protein